MDFNNRQYDPQTGRFLGVDPLAAAGGQDSYSPYAAMGNDPVSSTDPDGLMRNQTPQLNTFSHFVFFDIWAGFSASTLEWAGLGNGGGYLDFRYWYDEQFGSGWRLAGSTGKTITFTGEAARAVMSLLVRSTNGGADVIAMFAKNFNPGGDGGRGMTVSSDGTYASSLKEWSSADGSEAGAEVQIAYLANANGYSDLEWIQVFRSNSYKDKTEDWQLDGNPFEPNPPFYFSEDGTDRERAQYIAKDNGYTSYFADGPSRPRVTQDYYWQAHLTLVGKQNGVYVPIISFTYGYRLENSRIQLIPLQAVKPNILPVFSMPMPPMINFSNSLR